MLPFTGIGGVLVVHTFTMYPFFYLAASAALTGMDPSVEEAAYNLGAAGSGSGAPCCCRCSPRPWSPRRCWSS